MIKCWKTRDVSRAYPGRAVKCVGDGYLLTPDDRKVPPRELLVVDKQVYTDLHGNILNGLTPILLSDSDAQRIAGDIQFDLKGRPTTILFLKSVTIDTKNAYRVVRPSQATHVLLCSSWNKKDQGSPYTGATKRYANKQPGVDDFYRYAPKSNQRGQDFWRLSAKTLSKGTIQAFDQAWAFRINQAIDDHAAHYPRDVDFVRACRERLGPVDTQTKTTDQDANMCTPPQD